HHPGRGGRDRREFRGLRRRVWLDPELPAAGLRRGAVDHLILRTDAPFLPRLRGFLQRRANLGRGTR
ncbi:MAG: hypothetical protein ACKOET_03400, partial [Verrucomicrobiota bacterium]